MAATTRVCGRVMLADTRRGDGEELLEERAALAADCYFPAVTCRLKPPRDADQSTGTGGCPAHSAVNRAAGLPRLLYALPWERAP